MIATLWRCESLCHKALLALREHFSAPPGRALWVPGGLTPAMPHVSLGLQTGRAHTILQSGFKRNSVLLYLACSLRGNTKPQAQTLCIVQLLVSHFFCLPSLSYLPFI